MKRKGGVRTNYLLNVAYVLPAFALWFALFVYPNISVYPVSLFKWNGMPSSVMKFVGFDNYVNFFSNPAYGALVYRTLLYIAALIAVQTPLALFLALMIFRMKRMKGFMSGLFFSPVILSTVVVSLTWKYMYDPNLGVFNEILSVVGLSAYRTNWLETGIAPVFAVVIHVWHKVGYPITIFLAGLTVIPDSLYDAADVDGADGTARFMAVTLPLLMPTVLRILLLTIITGGLAFDYSYLLGPISSNVFVSKVDTLAVWLYKSGQAGNNLGWPAAVGTVLSAVFFLVYLIYHRVSKAADENVQS